MSSSSALRLPALALALAASASASAATPARSRWEVRLGTDVRYDSNVLELSAHDRKLVGDPLHADRFRLSSVDDVLVRPHLELEWSKNVLKQRTTSLTLGLHPTLYTRNPYLDRQRWALAFEQELGRDRRPTMSRVAFEADWTPETTLRRLKDDEASLQQGRTVRVDARYASWSARAEGTIELVPKLMALDLGVDREERDYRHELDERDGHVDAWDARLVGAPNAHWRLRAGWRSELMSARGDNPATGLTEDDVSSRREIASADARIAWGKERVSFGVERERRTYLAKSPFDFYHHGRSDERFGWRVGWHAALPHALSLDVEAAGDGNRATFSAPPPGITAEDATDYDATTFTVSLGWHARLGEDRKAAR